MLRALSRTTAVTGALAQRQVVASTRIHTSAAFHSSAAVMNTNSKSNSGNSSSNSSNNIPDIFASLLSNKNSASGSSSSSSRTTSSLFGSRRSVDKGVGNMPLFGFAPKANTTANPIHLDTSHPNEGRSFRVASPAAVDQTYRRLRSAINQSNMKRELRLKRNYETGHVRMRRESQERNKKLFGAMVRKKIELIKLMKIRYVECKGRQEWDGMDTTIRAGL
ncbi:hypothetical protein BGZ75_009396 [Mortierella antarctica]|nr:hypothetical protein BGZ75_009396 [Mortierella antarctica]